ncbi:Coiled-coil domain-containing protein 13 [Heterocephalus glaber]|uniref:Coiled-coil domain-containing protein 13 n=1 Tax=Heterocephalus glaber TaxID=10181 RepID=G5ALY3_HETGA|nr:Coiled-coil domain-containing protein 13 [Heterocephalus glaber]
MACGDEARRDDVLLATLLVSLVTVAKAADAGVRKREPGPAVRGPRREKQRDGSCSVSSFLRLSFQGPILEREEHGCPFWRSKMASDEASQDTVRLQFKAMQELQHRRLQKQMEAKREKSLHLQSHADHQEGPSGVSEWRADLPQSCGQPVDKLEDQSHSPVRPCACPSRRPQPWALTPPLPPRVLEDEVQQLREELRETSDENGRLYKLLKERDFELKHLKKKIEEDRLAFTGTAGPAGDLVATKVVELSKRNRVLAAESEAARARVKQLSSRVQELERELQTALARLPAKGATDAGAKPTRPQMGDSTLLDTLEVKALQDRLVATNLKMSDLRNQVQAVKQELRVAQKVLASEVGEDVSVQQLLSSPGTWRGRAQQILVLQSKVRELEKRLGQSQSRSAGTASDQLSVHPDPRKLSPQERNLQRIRSLERERQEGWEKLAGERDALQGELEELKRKFEGARSRNKILSSEVKTLRGQMGTLAEKGRHDDELIDALMEQLKQLQETLSSLSLQEEKVRTSQRHQDQEAHSEAQRSSSLVAQLQAMVAEREAKVQQLELEVRQLGMQDRGAGEGSCRPEVNPTGPRLAGDQARSPGSTGDHAGRLGPSRAVSSLGHTLVESALTRPSLPSPHGTTPRFPDPEEQKGWQAQATEAKALWQAAEVERDRLGEFVTVLQRRAAPATRPPDWGAVITRSACLQPCPGPLESWEGTLEQCSASRWAAVKVEPVLREGVVERGQAGSCGERNLSGDTVDQKLPCPPEAVHSLHENESVLAEGPLQDRRGQALIHSASPSPSLVQCQPGPLTTVTGACSGQVEWEEDFQKALETPRVEDSSTRLLEAERELRAARQRSVVLEQQLEKVRLEPGRASARGRAGLPASSTRNNPTGSKKAPSSAPMSNVPVESQVEELTARCSHPGFLAVVLSGSRLAVQVEENELLRTALGSALRGKEEDFRVYHETLAQVKGVFLQALRQQRTDGH